MRTIDSRWRNLAKGHEKLLELERQFQATWKEKVERTRQQKYQTDLDAWNRRRKQRAAQHQQALAVWKEGVAERNLRLQDAARSGTRRAVPLVPASVLALILVTLLGFVDISATQVIIYGIFIGFAIAFASAAFILIELIELHLKRPSLKPTEDPRPQQTSLAPLTFIDQWWKQIRDDGTHQGKTIADYGDVGESTFIHYLEQNLSDDYISIRSILVKPGLDVDILIVGPTNVWIFEVKYWSGVITCRNGSWWRVKSYYAAGGSLRHEEQQIEPFDRQWVRECKEVRETLRRHVHPPYLASTTDGGIVFAHPKVSLDIDTSCMSGYGLPEFWLSHLRKVAAQHAHAITQQSKLEIIDALLNRAEKVDPRYGQRRCCIELAVQLADNMTNWAKNYVASHTSQRD